MRCGRCGTLPPAQKKKRTTCLKSLGKGNRRRRRQSLGQWGKRKAKEGDKRRTGPRKTSQRKNRGKIANYGNKRFTPETCLGTLFYHGGGRNVAGSANGEPNTREKSVIVKGENLSTKRRKPHPLIYIPKNSLSRDKRRKDGEVTHQ